LQEVKKLSSIGQLIVFGGGSANSIGAYQESAADLLLI
jgi:hypothetical protein